MLDRPFRSPKRALISAAAVLLICLGAMPTAVASSSAASPALSVSATRSNLVLSSQPAQAELRQCMTEVLRLTITNESTKSTFVDLNIAADPPLWASNSRISTFVPARGTATVPLQLYVPDTAADGEYAVRISAGRSQLTVPVAVSAPSDLRCVPRSLMTVTASSAQDPENLPTKAIDGALHTIWHARFRPDRTFLPQWISFDLGGSYDVAELSYQPRVDGNLNGTVLAYTILASVDGVTFTEVASGTWAADATRKTVEFSAPGARHIRLLATDGVANYASAAEIVLFGRASSN